ncbi:MAG TPA: hypothetical protein VE172_17565 [Stackebrandtia sp.]|uniref:hypothetical protein n=1 Tax=Stackebrandtia sp. TaxID=2023065 RepID=UPI002D4502B8|nr:hypothetical protein [Stackebrandtia sp.]HZE40614.1 hypothetical protein [Stackebrandtia sp.]
MAEPRVPRARDGATEDDIVAAAFASYRASAPENFSAPSTTALMAKASGSRSRKRALTVSVAALACTGLMAAGVAVAQTVVDPGNTGPDAKGSGHHSSDTGKGDGSHGDGSSNGGSSSESDLHTMLITLPAFTGLDSRCPAGTYKFPTDDTSDPSDLPTGKPDESTDSAVPTQDPGDWTLLPHGSEAHFADVDGDGSQDAIVPVACGDTPGVIALSQTSKAFDSIGFVFAADKPGPAITVVKAKGDTVTLDIDASLTERQGPQSFVYRDGKFVPGSGDNPSTDPTDPGSDPETTPPGDGETSTKPDDPASTTSNDEVGSRRVSTVD